jgi:hypothetical protein
VLRLLQLDGVLGLTWRASSSQEQPLFRVCSVIHFGEPCNTPFDHRRQLQRNSPGADGKMRLPGLDVVFQAPALAVNVFVEHLRPPAREIGDDEAGIGSVSPGFSRARKSARYAPTASGGKPLTRLPYPPLAPPCDLCPLVAFRSRNGEGFIANGAQRPLERKPHLNILNSAVNQLRAERCSHIHVIHRAAQSAAPKGIFLIKKLLCGPEE